MKNTLYRMTLCAMLAATPLAQAAQDLATSGFNLGIAGSRSGGADLALLSDTGGTVKIALNGEPSITHLYTGSNNEPLENFDYGSLQLTGSVLPGYRITSLTLSGALDAWHSIETPDVVCGVDCSGHEAETGNRAEFSWTLTNGGGTTDLPGYDATNLDGLHFFAPTAATDVRGDFALDLGMFLSVTATGTFYQIAHYDGNAPWFSYHYYLATSDIWLSDLTLTAQVSAVPEPGTYAMLLAGMGLLAMAARKGRR